MEDSKKNSVFSSVINNKATKVLKDNQVVVGVTSTYIAGSTLAYYAAGVPFKTALAYTCGVAMVYGALGYGAYKFVKGLDDK